MFDAYTVLRTYRLLCLGIIRPLVRQEASKLARGSNKDVWVCRIRQTAGIYAIYLSVALDEACGSGHRFKRERADRVRDTR